MTEQEKARVAEGLPKQDGKYLATLYYGAIDISEFEHGCFWIDATRCDAFVTAWAPLPEPYRADKEARNEAD